MIYDILENSGRYAALYDGFAEAFAFLRRPDLRELAVDKYLINGDCVFAMVTKDQGRDMDEAQLEAHQKYIDIQMVLDGLDGMGWRPKYLCRQPVGAYDPDEDIAFFADPPAAWLPVAPGMFAVFFPEDAHLPLISSGMIHKVVVKVAVAKG